jgi:hypothetical protein
MPSSPTEREPAASAVVEMGQRLCGAPIVAVERCGGGGNNRVYRIETLRATFAMKCYGSSELDDRDRLGHEFDGLHFLKAAGIGSALPAAIAVDREARCALYEWIEGGPVTQHGSADIAAAMALLKALHAACEAAGAARLPEAIEAVLQLSDLTDQIGRRLARLEAVTPDEPELAAFLRDELRPEVALRTQRLSGWDVHAALAPPRRTLSPSDFGFHNALRRGDGSLAFIDFEYFGWDDPVKLVADFLWHPAMQLSPDERRDFLQAATVLYGADPTFTSRLAVCFPLYGLRWTLIILNEFAPQLWARRAFAGKGGDWATAKRDQLRRARTTLSAARSCTEGNLG